MFKEVNHHSPILNVTGVQMSQTPYPDFLTKTYILDLFPTILINMYGSSQSDVHSELKFTVCISLPCLLK